MSRIVVQLRDEEWTGWTSIVVSHSLGAAAGTVRLGGGALPDQGLTGREPIRVLIDGIAVLTGRLDEVEVSVSGEDVSFTASGRSLTGDLVDSDVDPYLEFGELNNVDVRDLAFRYATGGANVRVVSTLGGHVPRIPVFAPTPGESYFEAIERACRLTGTILTDNGAGALVLRDHELLPLLSKSIVEGVNTIAIRASTSWRERHRFVVVQGEGDSDADAWADELRILEEAEDEAIRPTRVRVVTLEGAATAELAKRRAQWEVAVRAARGSRVTVTVPGWRQDGKPWEQGVRVPVDLPSVGVRETLVLDSVTLSYGESGELATLGFARGDAYRLAPKLKAENDPTGELLGAGQA